jgi:hypothetical protein
MAQEPDAGIDLDMGADASRTVGDGRARVLPFGRQTQEFSFHRVERRSHMRQGVRLRIASAKMARRSRSSGGE